MTLIIIGHHGETYLFAPADVERGDPDPTLPVRVADTASGTLSPPVWLDSYLARNPHVEWYTPDEGEVDAVLARLEPAEGALPLDEIGTPIQEQNRG